MNKETELSKECQVDNWGEPPPFSLEKVKKGTVNRLSDSIKIERKVFRPMEFIIERLLQIISFISLVCIILIFTFVFREASSIFFTKDTSYLENIEGPETYGEDALENEIPLDDGILHEETTEASSIRSILSKKWTPVSLKPNYGIIPLLLGSINVAMIAILLGAPTAVFAALYTSMFAPKKIKELVKPVVEILAGFPSVVIGFFALIVIASLVQNLFGFQYRLNAFVGGIALSLAIIPIIFTIAEDSLNAVPRAYVDASLALGAEKWETALFVVLPSAMPGIFAAVLLGIGRAIGETMIVLMATGNAAIATLNPFSPVRTMSATIGAEMAEVVFGDFHYGTLFFIGVLLFLISFVLNLLAETVVRKLVMRRYS